VWVSQTSGEAGLDHADGAQAGSMKGADDGALHCSVAAERVDHLLLVSGRLQIHVQARPRGAIAEKGKCLVQRGQLGRRCP